MSGRRLTAKPEALEAARNRNPTHFAGGPGEPLHPVDPAPYVRASHLVGNKADAVHVEDPDREAQSTRVLNASLAVVRLKDAADHAKEAHAALVFLGLPSSHHAVVAAKRCADEARKAAEHAKLVLKTVMR